MKKILVLFASTIICGFVSTAQQSAKAIFFEIGGLGLASFNYDMRFSKKEDGLGFRAGFGGFSIDNETLVFIPIGLNHLMGKDNKNYFELGAGATMVITNIEDQNGDRTFKNTFGHLNFGYRYQPARGGIFFRATINPIFGKGFFIPYYGGISLGYKF